MPKIEYITDGDADEVEVFGVSFSDGKAVDVSDDIAARLKGNPYFKVSHSAKKSEDDEAAKAKAKADQEKADRAADEAKAKAEKEAADKAAAEEAERLKAEQSQSGTLKAVHNGGGRFVIKDGDKIVKDGLNKADADAFNALIDADKAEYVKD